MTESIVTRENQKTAHLLLVTISLTRFLGLSLPYGFYISGIYYEPNCSSSVVTHSMLLVGYGFTGRESDGRKYWLVKNRYKLPKLFIFGVGRR
jgi:hypothetical protein